MKNGNGMGWEKWVIQTYQKDEDNYNNLSSCCLERIREENIIYRVRFRVMSGYY